MDEEIRLRSMVEQKDSLIISNLMHGRNDFHFNFKEFADGKSPVGEGSEGIFYLDVGLDQADGTHPVEHPNDLEEVDDFLKNPQHLGNKMKI